MLLTLDLAIVAMSSVSFWPPIEGPLQAEQTLGFSSSISYKMKPPRRCAAASSCTRLDALRLSAVRPNRQSASTVELHACVPLRRRLAQQLANHFFARLARSGTGHRRRVAALAEIEESLLYRSLGLGSDLRTGFLALEVVRVNDHADFVASRMQVFSRVR